MSFKDFNEEGPGTFSWDYVLGGNTTGLFPEESHYILEGNTLTEVTYTHTGGGSFRPAEYGLSFEVENISPVAIDADGCKVFTFEQEGCLFRATINNKFNQTRDAIIVDVVQLNRI